MVAKKADTFKMPKSLALCADAFYLTRQRRYAMQREIKNLETYEHALRERIIRDLPKGDATGIAGRVARVTRTEREQPQVVDWDKLYAYIKKRDAWELLQKRLSDGAVRERWDDDLDVPGVTSFIVIGLSVEKLK